MPLPCHRCKKRTVEIKRFEVKKVHFQPMMEVVSEMIVEARCSHCPWGFRESERVTQNPDRVS
jgi:hypothetical protein